MLNFLQKIFHIYIKISKNVSAKYYQDKKERLQKNLVKDIKVFLRKEKEESNNLVEKDIKVYQNMNYKNWLSIEKILQNEKKRLIIIIRKITIFFKWHVSIILRSFSS